MSAIHEEARVGNLERVKALLKDNPDLVFSKDDDGTPLHKAAAFGNKAVAEFLLANKADVNAKGTVAGWTPLRMAVAWNHNAVAELLRRHGGRE
jgi:26S proteasome non-ATPase regulatory subunit 10